MFVNEAILTFNFIMPVFFLRIQHLRIQRPFNILYAQKYSVIFNLNTLIFSNLLYILHFISVCRLSFQCQYPCFDRTVLVLTQKIHRTISGYFCLQHYTALTSYSIKLKQQKQLKFIAHYGIIVYKCIWRRVESCNDIVLSYNL